METYAVFLQHGNIRRKNMKFINNIKNIICDLYCKFFHDNCNDKGELYDMMKDKNLITKEFEKVYEDLLQTEDEFKDILTEYATGNEDVNMKKVDAKFAEIKNHLKEIRSLALEHNIENEDSKDESENDDNH